MKFRQVTVRVPATTANLGPGFDCLGLALGLWNRLRLEVGPSKVSVIGEGADVLSRGEDNLVLRAASAVFQEAGLPNPSLRLSCRNAIPLSRGLGSSAAAVVAGLVAANTLCGDPLAGATLLRLATALEGHPDNVAPALLGGCQIVVQDGEHLVTAGVRVPRWLRAVAFIPEVAMPTQEARAVLPRDVSRRDAVYNVGRVALLVNALATGKAEDLRVATQDALHQPARQRLFPAMESIIQAALQGGALGAFLSGAGSSVVAFTRGREVTVGYEMAEAARKWGVDGAVRVLRPVSRGCYVVSAS